MSDALRTEHRTRHSLGEMSPGRRLRLWLEFLTLFAGMPILMATQFGRFPLFPVLFALAGVSAFLLWRTPDFRLSELLRGPVLGEWRIILGFTLAVAAVSAAVVLALVPDRFLDLPTHRPGLWVMIMLLYPFVSVVPQELIYRPLFFRRYGSLFPNVGTAVAVNAVAFGLGHLFFMSWVTVLMTGFGGLVIGWAYMRHRSFLLACVLHSIAGQIVFTSGLGVFFYSGAIGLVR